MNQNTDTPETREQIEIRVNFSIQELFEKDLYLLAVNANERSITHCLANYLQLQFPSYNVDCEYNRDGIEPKRLGHLDLYPNSHDEDAQTVFPDIVVHRRGTNENLLVIEVKKRSNPANRETDILKLRGYQRELGYRFALFVEFGVGDHSPYHWPQWIEP